MKLQFKRLHPDAILPTRATPGSAGYDVHALDDAELGLEPVVLPLGWSVAIPDGWCGILLGRSGLAFRTRVYTPHIGLIDSDYRGEVCALLWAPQRPYHYITKGDAVAQLVIVRHLELEPEWVEDLPSTARGAGGFGSTGR